MQETQVWSLDQKDPLEEEMVTHYSILAWKIPWREEPGGLQSMGSQRVRHTWATEHEHRCKHLLTCILLCLLLTSLRLQAGMNTHEAWLKSPGRHGAMHSKGTSATVGRCSGYIKTSTWSIGCHFSLIWGLTIWTVCQNWTSYKYHNPWMLAEVPYIKTHKTVHIPYLQILYLWVYWILDCEVPIILASPSALHIPKF